MIIYTILAQQAQDNSNSSIATIIVGVIGLISGASGGYFVWMNKKTDSKTTLELSERDQAIKERSAISDEWRALREYQNVQLQAERKEIEILENQNRSLESAVIEKDKIISQLRADLFALHQENLALEAQLK